MRIERGFSSILISSALFLSMISAHVLGGAAFEFNPALPLILIASIIFLYFKKLNEFSGPQLAALLLLFQFMGHFVVGTHSMATAQMSIAHGISGVLGFLTVRHCERCIAKTQDRFVAIFLPQVFDSIRFAVSENVLVFLSYTYSFFSHRISSIRDRAPPRFATFSIEPTTA